MHLIDKMEKAARLGLWVVISAVLVVGFAVVPLRLVEQAHAEAALREQLDASKAKLDEALDELTAPKSRRIPLRTMGTHLRALDFRSATGKVWFTNVSPRRGFVCVEGIATHEATGNQSSSLPACAAVEPYSSTQAQMMFASGDLSRVCPKISECSFSIAEAGDPSAPELASND